jgi:acyl carrier protein
MTVERTVQPGPTGAALHELLRAHSPLAASHSELPAELPLGAGGLGLDSIAVAELLLACERRFGVAPGAELLAGPALTVGGLLAHLRAAAPP